MLLSVRLLVTSLVLMNNSMLAGLTLVCWLAIVNEIGFSGPAYPRGYLNPGINAREHFEVADRHDLDPIPFAERVERARKNDDDLPARGIDA